MARQRGLGFIYVTVVLDALAISVVVPVLPNLVGAITSFDAPKIAGAVGALTTLFAFMQFFAATLIGVLSDRFGRRPIVLASNVSLGLDFAIMAWAPTLPWLAFGRLISGVAAGSGPAAYAYVADVTAPEQRAGAFGMLFGAQAAGATLGPAIGGLLSGVDLRAPFWVAAALCVLNALYGYLALPESLPRTARATHIAWRQTNPLGAIIWLARAYPRLRIMIAVAFLLSFASQGANSITVLYTQFRYHWSPATIGVVLTVFGLASLAVQAMLVTPVASRAGAKATFVGGLSLTTMGLILFGAAATPSMFLIGVPLLALGSICGPVMAGFFSNAVASDAQGRLQGAWSGVNAAMGLVAPGAFALMFAFSIPQAPGFAFFVGAALLAVAALLALRAVSARVET